MQIEFFGPFWQTASLYIGIIFYLLAAYNCYRIFVSQSPHSIIYAWIFFHILLPFAAVPIYIIFGAKRIQNYHDPSLYQNRNTALPLSELERLDNRQKGFAKLIHNLTEDSSLSANEITLLIDGRITFDSIFSAINKAKRTICVQYYIIRSDRIGRELKNLLEAKCRAGLKVYVIYDGFGSFWLSRHFIGDLKRAGIEVVRFMPIFNVKNFGHINYRNHRKVVIVDGEVAFTGGLNIGDEYIGRKRARRQFWRDTHIKMSGPMVSRLLEQFISDWSFTTHKTPEELLEERQRSVERYASEDTFNKNSHPSNGTIMPASHLPTASSAKNPYPTRFDRVLAQCVHSGPADERKTGILFFKNLIAAAEQRVVISTPYLIPDPVLFAEIESAQLRGVNCQFIIPLRPDHKFVHWASIWYASQLSQLGVDIFLYKKGFLHQKVVTIDDKIGVIGTCNFDLRALNLNFETSIVLYELPLIASLNKMLDDDKRASISFTEHFQKVKPYARYKGVLAKLLSPLL